MSPGQSAPQRGGYKQRDVDRPLGVTLIVVLGGIVSVFGLFNGVGLAATLGKASALGVVVGLVVLLVNLFRLGALYGLYLMERWGWRWFLGIEGLGILATLLAIVVVLQTFTLGLAVGVVFGVALWAYVYSLGHLFESQGYR